MTGYDVAVIGGGLVGSAIAYGLARQGDRVALLDEGDRAFRASRGNFGLVWVQSKGLGMGEYANWTVRSSDSWGGLAQDLGKETGIDTAFVRPGGMHLCLSEDELQRRDDQMKRLHNQQDMTGYKYEILDRAATEKLVPHIGPEVAGASYCPIDGHANPLRLLRALHQALDQRNMTYLPNHPVSGIQMPSPGRFVISTPKGTVEAGKVVIAAGLANATLGPMVGLNAPVRPVRGQIIVTERMQPFLDMPMVTVRQTNEGSVMIGDSQEEAGFDDTVGPAILATMANRAVRMFPKLAGVNVVRTWGALRVMSPDGFPIYDQSESHPGAFVATCHSGVTLAAAHALHLAPHIHAGTLPEEFKTFSARRFDVSAAA